MSFKKRLSATGQTIVCWLCLGLLSLVVPISAFAQVMPKEYFLDYLVIPEPECGISWEFQMTFFDPVRANPSESLVKLKADLRKAEASNATDRMAAIKIDMAVVYNDLDSSKVSQRYANEALDYYKMCYLYSSTAEIAYGIGRAYDRLDKDDNARQWYEQAIKLDDEFFPAYTGIVKGLSSLNDTTIALWARNAKQLAEQLINSNRNPALRAEVALQYANMRIDLRLSQEFLGIFDFIADQVRTPSDSSEFEQAMISRFKMWIEGFCSPEVIDLLATASELDPDKTQYQLMYSAAQLGRIFLSMFDYVSENSDQASSASMDEVLNQVFADKYSDVRTIRARLLSISDAEKVRFPATYYYLAFSNAILGEYEDAYNQAMSFIQYKPDNMMAHMMHCGIAAMLAGAGAEDGDQIINDLAAISERKCEEYPTEADCYRSGYIKWQSGDIYASNSAFQLAATLDGDDVRPRIARAVTALQLGEIRSAQVIARSLRKEEDKLGDSNLACYNILQAVLAVQQGNLTSALSWAEKAVKADSSIPQADWLLEELQKQ